jgi:hypothetical protein
MTALPLLPGCLMALCRIRRHNAIADVIALEARRGDITVAREKALFPDVRNPRREADVQLTRFLNGRDAALDITIVSSQSLNYIHLAATNAQRALQVAETAKRNKYRESIRAAEEQGVSFVPMAADIYGNWSTGSRVILAQLAKAAADVNQVPVSREKARFSQRLAITLLRQQAWAIIERRPNAFDA